MSTQLALGILVGFGLAQLERGATWLHGRWRRRHVAELTIDALFDAVAKGQMTSEAAAEEIVNRWPKGD